MQEEMSAQAKFAPNNNPTSHAFHRVIVLSSLLVVLLLSSSTAPASAEEPPTAPTKPPLISRLAKDPETSLYTISIKADRSPLVVDLAGSLVWSTCPPPLTPHGTVPCHKCTGAGDEPFNPVTRECSSSGPGNILTSFPMSANATDGVMELYPPEESFAVTGKCAPRRLLRSFPAAATGVAGFSRRPLSLPSQLAARRLFGNKFSLCLPFFATFGDTPVFLSTPDPRGFIDYTAPTSIPYTPLLTNAAGGGYYIPIKAISVSWHGEVSRAAIPAGALDLDLANNHGGVVLSTATQYGHMRRDVFDAFAAAFDDAITRGKIPMTTVERVAPAKGEPFELCYRGGFPMLKRPAVLDVPRIDLELGDGATGNWTLFNGNYMVQTENGLCVGILPMDDDAAAGRRGGMHVEGEPAVVLGGKQLENNLLVFDLEKNVLGFSMLLDFRLSGCMSSKFFRN